MFYGLRQPILPGLGLSLRRDLQLMRGRQVATSGPQSGVATVPLGGRKSPGPGKSDIPYRDPDGTGLMGELTDGDARYQTRTRALGFR